MKPFLRPTDRPSLAPIDWTTEPAGQWAGKDADIVYDPHRHRVLLVRNDIGNLNRAAIAETGYRRLTVEGDQGMWLRVRVAQTHPGQPGLRRDDAIEVLEELALVGRELARLRRGMRDLLDTA